LKKKNQNAGVFFQSQSHLSAALSLHTSRAKADLVAGLLCSKRAKSSVPGW